MTTQKFDMGKYIKIRDSLSPEEMFLLYNTLNYLVNSKTLYSDDMRPYSRLAKKIRGMLTQ